MIGEGRATIRLFFEIDGLTWMEWNGMEWNYTILYYTILYYTILYYTILYYTILYYTYLIVARIKFDCMAHNTSE
jgi:hypothetical protein